MQIQYFVHSTNMQHAAQNKTVNYGRQHCGTLQVTYCSCSLTHLYCSIIYYTHHYVCEHVTLCDSFD
jgi:hypothetical protein